MSVMAIKRTVRELFTTSVLSEIVRGYRKSIRYDKFSYSALAIKKIRVAEDSSGIVED